MTIVNKARQKGATEVQAANPGILGQADGDVWLNTILNRTEVFVDKTDQWTPLHILGDGETILGNLWAWGYNNYGQLGLNDTIARSSPVQISSVWLDAHINTSSYGRKADGTLWAWGYNTDGRLGLGDFAHRSSPTQIGNLTNWKRIFHLYTGAGAIKMDGTLWVWGYNAYGNLGLGDTTYRNFPTQVGTHTNWSCVSAASAAGATKTDGTLWAWGPNDFGRLGLGDVVTRSSPVQVGAMTNWSKIVMSAYNLTASLKTDGTLWTWGYNLYGTLGSGNTISRSSPAQVGASVWKAIAIGYQHMIGIKTDGTLWTWGRNNYGQLGLNDVINRSEPIQVGTLTTWADVCSIPQKAVSYARRTDGTLWAWGYNNGQLGVNDIIGRSSPVQVGNMTTWKHLQFYCGLMSV